MAVAAGSRAPARARPSAPRSDSRGRSDRAHELRSACRPVRRPADGAASPYGSTTASVLPDSFRLTSSVAPLTQLGPTRTTRTSARPRHRRLDRDPDRRASSTRASQSPARLGVHLPVVAAHVTSVDGRVRQVAATWPPLLVGSRVSAADLQHDAAAAPRRHRAGATARTASPRRCSPACSTRSRRCSRPRRPARLRQAAAIVRAPAQLAGGRRARARASARPRGGGALGARPPPRARAARARPRPARTRRRRAGARARVVETRSRHRESANRARRPDRGRFEP